MNGSLARDEATTSWSEQISGGPPAARAARELLSDRVGDSVQGERLHDVLLLATELVTNAVLHAGVDESQTLELHATAGPGALRLAVVDPGGVTEPEVQELDLTAPGGMGLFLVQQLSDRWGVQRAPDGGREVWFEVATAAA
jgi:anti-sigma regulatory factor (Ser/Thr protein kinase)